MGLLSKYNLKPLDLIRIAFYPLTNLIWNPIALTISLTNCISILNTKGINYNHFNIYSSINHLFYRTRHFNLKKFGKSGVSNLMGLGNAKMSRNFHYSMLSLSPFVANGTLFLLLTMTIWAGSHYIWYSFVSKEFLTLTLILLFISSSFYSNLFRLQNYNMLSWTLLPLTLYCIENNDLLLGAAAMALMAMFSFTGGVIAILLGAFVIIVKQDVSFILLPAFAVAILLFYLFPFFKNSKESAQLLNLWRALGGSKKVKYKRIKSKGWGIKELYKLLLVVQFIVVYYVLFGSISYFTAFALLILIVNTQFARFADEQTINIISVSMASADVLLIGNYMILPSFWLLINPIPIFSGFFMYKDAIDLVPIVRPCSPDKIINDIDKLLEPVQKGDRVMMAFKDPDGMHENIFNGYRILTELVDWSCTKKEVHFFPDWLAVNELNYEGSKNIWGRSPKECAKNLREWDAEYLIHYTVDEAINDQEWKAEDFTTLGCIDWNNYSDDFKILKKPNITNLKWHLLNRPLSKK